MGGKFVATPTMVLEHGFSFNSCIGQCGNCRQLGELGSSRSNNIYIFEVEPLTFEIRSNLLLPFHSLKPKRVKIPTKYEAMIYAGCGSNLDMYFIFLQKEQLQNLPRYICQDCFWKKFSGQVVGLLPYFEEDGRITEERLNPADFFESLADIIPFPG